MCVCSLPTARFIVHVRSPGVIMLQNKQESQHYLAIRDGNLCTVGGHCMSAMQGYIGTFVQSWRYYSLLFCRVQVDHSVNSTSATPISVS